MAYTEMTDALRNGIRAARRKDHAAAQRWLRQAAEAEPDREEAWLWLGRVADDPAERRQALERALALNPDNRWARDQLAAPPPAEGGPSAAPPAGPKKPRIETLQCPSCGGTVTIRNSEGAQTVVCQYCGSVLDLTPEQAAIVGQTNLKTPALQPIELGMKGTFGGVEHEVVGWLRYRGAGDGESWVWNEWLLLGADGSVRWLSYDSEVGFLLQQRMPITRAFDPDRTSRLPLPDGSEAYVTERAQATLQAIRGELTWRATVGDRIRYLEATRGATHYSVEYSRDELELSAGERLSDAAVWRAFGQTARAEAIAEQNRRGPAFRQIGKLSVWLALVSLLLFGMAGCIGRTVLNERASLPSTGASAAVGSADLDAGVHRLRLRCDDPPMGRWALISVWAYDAKNTKYHLGSLNCWAESGMDEDGRWEEKNVRDHHPFKPQTPGPYRFEMTLDEANYTPVSASVEVDAGAWHRLPFAGAAAIFGVIAFVAFSASQRR